MYTVRNRLTHCKSLANAAPRISVIVPTLNEAACLAATLDALALAPGDELIVVDAGSTDGTPDIARRYTSQFYQGPRGRAQQMNHGARHAAGDILLFLHADTLMPTDGPDAVRCALQQPGTVGGAFRLVITPPTPALRLVAWGTNLRSRFGGLPYGDQALFVSRRVFEALGGYDDVPFMESNAGRRLAAATAAEATALLEISPAALVFGAWHSQGEGGGLGAKFPRALVSEIMGIDTPVEGIVRDRRTNRTEPQTAGRRTGSRIDPLGVLRKVDVFKSPTGWNTDQQAAGKGAKKVRPSEINHGNIAPSVTPLGVTCAYAEHRAVLTLAGLRRLHFGGGNRDAAGRALLAALALLAIVEQDARGYALRSRCDLVCDDDAPLQLVHADGSTEPFSLDLADARGMYREAYDDAELAAFDFSPLMLKPQPKLVEIVQRSRELALEGEGRDDQTE